MTWCLKESRPIRQRPYCNTWVRHGGAGKQIYPGRYLDCPHPLKIWFSGTWRPRPTGGQMPHTITVKGLDEAPLWIKLSARKIWVVWLVYIWKVNKKDSIITSKTVLTSHRMKLLQSTQLSYIGLNLESSYISRSPLSIIKMIQSSLCCVLRG